MNTMKKMGLFVFSIFALLLVASFGSALTISNVPSSLSQSDGSFDILVSSDSNETINLEISDIETIDFSLSDSSFDLNSTNPNKTITVTYTGTTEFDFEFGKEYSTVLNASGNVSISNKTATFTFIKTNFCKYGETGNDLEITEINIDNIGGGDDEEWEFLDKIEVEISVENTDDEKSISSVEVEIMILDKAGEDVTNDFFEDSDDKILDYGRISDNTEESKIIELNVDPIIEEGSYKLYVKAYKDGNEDDYCTEESEDFVFSENYLEFEVAIGDGEVGIDNLEYPDTFLCGSSNTISFDFYNFDLSHKEEDMRINLFNNDLGIDIYSNKFDLRKGKEESLLFYIDIPENAEEKTYNLQVYYEYGYDEDDNTYDDDDQAEEIRITVEGNCRIQPPQINAVLDSEAVEGKELTISAVLTNLGPGATYSLVIEGYEDWASLKDVSKEVLILNEGQSEEISIKLYANGDSEGSQLVNIKVYSNGKLVLEQPLAVQVEKGTFNLGEFLKNNWKIIGLIVLILVLVWAITTIIRKR